MFTTLIAIVFTLVLVVGVPALSYSTARNSEIRKMPRLALYLSAAFSQWLLTVVGLGVVFLVARRVFVQGFAALPWSLTLEWGVGIAAAALLALSMVILCERRGWLPRESDLVYLLIPETPRERLWALLVIAPTAAFCEEFLFRGYLLTQLHDWLHSLLWAWVVSSLAFGLAHCYQGWSGMTRAGLLGALLAYPVVRSGSLYPAMLAHWMIDTVALVWLGHWMVGMDTSADGKTIE
ncbi:MAG: CPBP family intramembrane glutamic endopeptidase [Terriglobia bacterium]|jgi:membrane protease YdiL (CAAX protease family)